MTNYERYVTGPADEKYRGQQEAVDRAMAIARRPCPLCSSPMTREHGTISEPRITRHMQIERVARPATFWSCWTCEHCEEAR